MVDKTVNILGIRGVPAAHGGFETFAARLALYLTERGWKVNVYCQVDVASGESKFANYSDTWCGVRRTHMLVKGRTALASVWFDWWCIWDVLDKSGVDLVLGYNTAIFSTLQRLRGRRVLMNMDGIEWKRAKWSLPVKMWFYLNELVGYYISSLPIADHPEIARHLSRLGRRKTMMIPYGADRIEAAPEESVRELGVDPNAYILAIGRIEPENSLLEIVSAFSRRKRNLKLVVLGNLSLDNAYHSSVRAAASDNVVFPGAIYDSAVVSALRFHARVYLHGHQVGGTNPSLVEALGAGNPVIAHDNPFNRWVAGPEQRYFKNCEDLFKLFDSTLYDENWLDAGRRAAVRRFNEAFTWDRILSDYENILSSLS